MITSSQLVSFMQMLLDTKAVYWWGTYWNRCTADLYSSKKRQYPAHYKPDRATQYRAHIAAKRMAVDCAGAIKGAVWSDAGAHTPKYGSNGCPDKSADDLFAWCLSKKMRHGNMKKLPEIPGIMLHKDGHAGVYIGAGWAIEARGFDEGVQKTRVLERGWTGWTLLPFVKYEADGSETSTPPMRMPVIVDVSEHSGLFNKKNDWSKIAKNVDLLILRCGVTRTETKPLGIGIDAEFLYAAKQCQKYNIPFGVYYYGKVRTTAEARQEARKAYDIASPYKPLFYVYDVEEARLSNAMVEAWMDEMRGLGAQKVGLYIAHQMYTKFKVAATKADFVWIPRYGKNTGLYDPNYKPSYPCDLHQYTSVGSVPGFADKTLDLNRLTGTKSLEWFLNKGGC